MVNTINSRMSTADRFGTIAVRLGFRRNSYSITPGLYNLNNPDATSPVFVSANYKLSFDILRKSLTGISCRILVLDTKGINVWCAAGKGTFGTDELITRVNDTGLSGKVNHKTLIVPQLGAPGVEAHIVRRKTGFRIIYGPVEASDIPQFIADDYKKTPQMHQKTFTMVERIVLTPIEIVHSWKIFLPVTAANIIFFLFFADTQKAVFSNAVVPAVLGVLSGGLIMPVMLPWLPFRSFTLKGAVSGIMLSLLWFFIVSPPLEIVLFAGGLLVVTSAFIAMNFTGASTFTSLSGVKKEMKFAIPLLIISTILFITAAIITAVLRSKV